MSNASVLKFGVFFLELVLDFMKVIFLKNGFSVLHLFVFALSHFMTFSCDSQFKQEQSITGRKQNLFSYQMVQMNIGNIHYFKRRVTIV